MYMKRIVTRVYTENCYIFWDDEKKGGIIDPGSDFEKINKFIEENDIKIEAILLTHSHFDHMLSAHAFSNKYNTPVRMSYSEKAVFENPENSLDVDLDIPESFLYFKDGDILKIGNLELDIIETPGHTKGSVCFYNKEAKILFSGDTLFNETVGRWDLPTGNFGELCDSIKNKLYLLPDDVKVYSGHGFSTTIGKEKEANGVVRC